MSLHSWSIISNASSQTCYWALSSPRKPQNLVSNKPIFFATNPRRPSAALRAQLSDQIAEIVHNKVETRTGYSLFVFTFVLAVLQISIGSLADFFFFFWGLLFGKVLVAAGISAAIGQLSKPFTSVILYGKEFDIKATIQAGGFPSTHSSVRLSLSV